MSEMTTMQSAGLLMGMMTFLILVVGGILLAFRVYAGREYRHNHPASLDAHLDALLPAHRRSDAVEDVALGHNDFLGIGARKHA